jgi:UDP-N-acetylglucosamine--N-acetylmuramyl-(pentapeptide) pyrophosphoryl-undecaprenol N-acetylglucosamine transferase
MDNHQYENALYYKSKNTCWILEQKNFTSNNLSLLLLEIFNNNNDLKVKRKKMFYDRKTNTLDKIKKEILI